MHDGAAKRARVEVFIDSKPKILLVDDDSEFLADQKSLFEGAGGVLDTAINFKIAEKYLEEHFVSKKYDYIFIDYAFKKEKFNGDQFIRKNYDKMVGTPIAMIVGPTNYDKLIQSGFGKEFKIEILRKEAGLTQRLSQILTELKKLKDGQFNKFVEDIEKITVKYKTDLVVNEENPVTKNDQAQEEYYFTGLQDKIRELFLENIKNVVDQQTSSLILGNRKLSPRALYAEVEKPESEIGNMALEMFVSYLEFAIKPRKPSVE
jgi:DNA-binding NtrC family response regulator